jgi:hypothetical protein
MNAVGKMHAEFLMLILQVVHIVTTVLYRDKPLISITMKDMWQLAYVETCISFGEWFQKLFFPSRITVVG